MLLAESLLYVVNLLGVYEQVPDSQMLFGVGEDIMTLAPFATSNLPALTRYAGYVSTVTVWPLYVDVHVSLPAPGQGVRPLSVGLRLPPSLCPNSMMTISFG